MSDPVLLKRWMQEHFPYAMFRKMGLFTKEIRFDYEAQAKIICENLGLDSIYEYRKEEVRCHISFVGKARDEQKEFITVIPSLWDEE